MLNKKIFRIFLFTLSVFLISFNFVSAQGLGLGEELKGRLLLQVQSKGEIWYVHPDTFKKYEVNLQNSLSLFREFATGITSIDLEKIPLITESKSKIFGKSLVGKFFLDVENNGRVWYVDLLGFRHEVKQDNLLEIFRNLSLGISNADLEKIPSAGLVIDENKNLKVDDFSVEGFINNKYFQSFWQLWSVIKEKYVGIDFDEEKVFAGAKEGLVKALGDDYSSFMNAGESQDLLQNLSGHFEGIGAEVELRNGIVTIVAPLANMPAEKAGLKAGDKILKVDGVDLTGMTLNAAVKLIKGPKGTIVILSIERLDGTKKDIDVERGTITYDSLNYEILEGNIAYIKMIRFNSDSASLFKEAHDYFLENNVEGIVLDLRNNPGGYMNMAIDVAGYWTAGRVVLIEKKKNDTEITKHVSIQKGQLAHLSTMVLVNGGSASASEIVAGALQDHSLATIIGEKTFGKGSVQELTPLADGSYIKITTSKWYTPQDHSIDGEGINPDVLIEYTEEDYNQGIDTQLNKALELIRD